jgi:hypothetical protein
MVLSGTYYTVECTHIKLIHISSLGTSLQITTVYLGVVVLGNVKRYIKMVT